MSYLVDVTFVAGANHHDRETMAELQAYRDGSMSPTVRHDPERPLLGRLPVPYDNEDAAGDKVYTPPNIYAGCWNYLRSGEFVDHVLDIAWRHPWTLIVDDEGSGYTMIVGDGSGNAFIVSDGAPNRHRRGVTNVRIHGEPT